MNIYIKIQAIDWISLIDLFIYLFSEIIIIITTIIIIIIIIILPTRLIASQWWIVHRTYKSFDLIGE